jgi:hypothetical protein
VFAVGDAVDFQIQNPEGTMKNADKQHSISAGLDSIRADELLPLAILGQRFGLAKKSLILAQRQGLRTVKFGHRKYAFGKDILAFFDALRGDATNSSNST